MKGLPLIIGLVSLLIFNACSKQEPVIVQRADEELFQTRNPEDIQKWLDNHRDAAHAYFGTTLYGKDSALVNKLSKRVNDKELRVLYKQTHETFGTAGDLAGALSEAFTNIRANFPDFQPPKVVGMVTGFMGPDLVITDSLIVIGLDWFTGPGAKYRPDIPNYLLKRYQKEYIAPAIVLAIAKRYNSEDRRDQTLLADMVYYGKGYVFAKTMLPDAPDSLIIGYSDKQLTDTYAAQEAIWAYFIDAQLLFQTNPNIKERYLADRPFTSEVGTKAPGAIGRWLGWRIVGKYNDDKEPGIQELMNNANARQIFEASGYKGFPDDK
jgi:hypothetical protein